MVRLRPVLVGLIEFWGIKRAQWVVRLAGVMERTIHSPSIPKGVVLRTPYDAKHNPGGIRPATLGVSGPILPLSIMRLTY